MKNQWINKKVKFNKDYITEDYIVYANDEGEIVFTEDHVLIVGVLAKRKDEDILENIRFAIKYELADSLLSVI